MLETRVAAAAVGAAARVPRRFALALQRAVSWALGPIWVPLIAALLRVAAGYRIEALQQTRRQYRQIRRTTEWPLLICANHLTMIDSALIAWALGSPWWYLTHFSALPWNMPERQNFATSWRDRVLSYVMKCVPITRGGDRDEVVRTLRDFISLLARGEVGLIFPEGGRSRTARVEVANAAYGVGRIVQALPGCRVLCIYLRGDHQATFSNLSRRRDRFHVALDLIEPTSPSNGLRGERDIARQIVAHLADMEQRYFNDRQ